MLHNVTALRGMKVAALDGNIGSVEDVYFDDAKWAIRYLAVDAGGFVGERKVLLSPAAVRGLDWQARALQVGLTGKQVEDSPDIDTAKPVSRQHETEFYDYYGYPYYWAGPYLWGYASLPVAASQPFEQPDPQTRQERLEQERQKDDPHLRSSREVVGYHIQARDRRMGHLEDLLFDDEDWAIRMLVVDPRNWWPGPSVLVSPQRIEHIDWLNRNVAVNLTHDEIEHSPKYDAEEWAAAQAAQPPQPAGGAPGAGRPAR